jgi:nitroreductase
MEVSEAIQARKSVRSYDTKPVPEEVIQRLLETARVAPSASNRQPWHFVVVTDAEKRKGLTAGPYAKFLKESPVVIVGCGDVKTSPDWYAVDVAIALQQLVLAATAEGLGTCWIGSFYEDQVKALLKIPENFSVVAMMALGYPKEKMDLKALLVGAKSRKRMQEIVSREEFGKR